MQSLIFDIWDTKKKTFYLTKQSWLRVTQRKHIYEVETRKRGFPENPEAQILSLFNSDSQQIFS